MNNKINEIKIRTHNFKSNIIVQFGKRIQNDINLISKAFAFLSELALAVMMFLTAADVVMRYFFNNPIPGSLELIQFSMAIFNGAGIAYCAVLKGHVEVEVFVSKLPKRVQEAFSSVTSILSIVIFVIITLATYYFMRNMISLHAVSPELNIPVYPFVVVVLIGLVLLTIVLVSGLIESLYKVIKE